jgi:digeranylgeranylglycerophospholipid reductase
MISIVGGGPVGSYQAYLLAKQGKDVQVFEDHAVIGSPIQCTGILTHEIEKHLPMKGDFVVNKVNSVKIYAPNGKHATHVKFKKPDYIVCRTKFDQYIARLAQEQGAKYYLKHRYKSNQSQKIKVNDKILPTDLIIGADGPHSSVAKNNNMYGNRKFCIGNQVVVKTKCDPQKMEVWVGHGMFSWFVPESDTHARVGLCSYDKPEEHLKKLLKTRCPDAPIVAKQPGHIPIYNPKQILQKNNVFLIGDAATQVKATTYGGIVLGMKAAKVLAKDNTKYQKNFKKEVGRDLYLSLLMRKILDKFSIEEFNELVQIFSQDKLRNILETKSRDYPTKFVLELLIKEPRLLKYSKKLLF